MTQLLDRPEAVACAKGTLWGIARTGFLLAAAVLASVLLVEAPIPVGGVADRSPAYVPASDEWIELGAPARADPPIVAAALDPALHNARQGSRERRGEETRQDTPGSK